MSTKIEWTDATWNPVTGCSKISPGCLSCYAERMSKRLAGRCGYPADEPFEVTLHQEKLAEPLRWRKPRRVFVCSMGDLFHEDVPSEFIAAIFGVMAACPRHTFQVLTKRPKRALEWFGWLERMIAKATEVFRVDGPGWRRSHLLGAATMRHSGLGAVTMRHSGLWPLPNVWLGVTAEDQQRADERIPILLQVPAAVRFVSVEPMLGPVEIVNGRANRWGRPTTTDKWGRGIEWTDPLDWVICGCESGPGARPMHLDWARSLRDQCVAAGVPFFLKQAGFGGKIVKMPALDGQVWDRMPEVVK